MGRPEPAPAARRHRRLRAAPVAVRRAGAARLLLDAQGEVAARLVPGTEPTPGQHLVPLLPEPPVVTDEVRQAFAPAAPLPADLVAAGPEMLTGRWVPADSTDDTGLADRRPYVELSADGSWSGSDGCNGLRGRWISGPDGALLAVTGPVTLIGCGIPVGAWLSDTARAGLDGDLLVLLDGHGDAIGRLSRD